MSRKVIIDALETKFSDTAAVLYEHAIYDMCQRLHSNLDAFEENTLKRVSFDEFYNNIAYEKVGELFSMNKKEDSKMIVHLIIDGHIGYNSAIYDEYKTKQEINIEHIINPPEVQKGIYKCKKCKSQKTWSYQLQTRSGDEGFTNYINCSNCGNRWKIS